MIDLSLFKENQFYVVGLGTSGESAARALHAGGAHVTVWDDRAHIDTPFPICAPSGMDYAGLRALILGPGVPLTHPEPHPAVRAAKAAGVEIWSDVELMFRSGLKAQAIGLTGTNGKSTATALLHHVLTTLGYVAEIGGNFGPATLDLTDPGPGGFVVLELSSYQLDLSPGYPLAAACLLNMDIDHLDRHGTMAEYAAAKAKIFQRAERKFVTGTDTWSREIADQMDTILLPPSQWPTVSQNPGLSGNHQRQNQAAVLAMLSALGLSGDKVLAAMGSFPGIAHRQEVVGQSANWLFVNDSKATNVASAACALNAFSNIHWLVGGRGKDGGLDGLSHHLGQVQYAYIYGENASEVADFCRARTLPHAQFKTLDQAFAAATTAPGGTLLLSPAAASWDQYTSYAARGEHFRALAMPLIAKTETAA